MKLISRKRSRMAAAAVTAALALTPAAALATPGHQAARVVASTPACATSDLMVWLGIPGNGTAGSTYYELELSNTSSHTCTLFGFPGVSAVAPNGAQLGSAATRDHSDPTQLVTLAPLATAHVLLRIIEAGVFPPSTCQPTQASGLKVYPPNTTTATVVPYEFLACAKSGPVFLNVRTTVARTGIPFVSS
jgi:Protein of unknown function (DUF4232)